MAKSSVSPDVAAFTKDWLRLQQQKHRMRGGVESRMLLSLGMYFGEHGISQFRDSIQTRALGKDEDMNRLSLVFNMMRKAARKKMGQIWRLRSDFGATPNKIDPKAYDQADVVRELVRALDYKVGERLLHWKRVWWLVLTGVVINHTTWVEASTTEPIPAYDPETNELLWKDTQSGQVFGQSVVERAVKQGIPPERFSVVEHLATVGDVTDDVISGLNFFIDSAVPTIKQLPHDQACYIAELRTVGWIKEMFGSDVADQVTSKVGDDLTIVKTKLLDRGPSLASMNLRDLIPAIQGARSSDDPPMAIVLTRYQPGCDEFPNGRRSILVPHQAMLDDDETPYGEIPCVDIHFDAPTNGFWTGDFMTDMVPPQKFLNKRFSQMGEAANATIHEVLLLGGELDREDIPTDIPGHVVNGLTEEGVPLVQALQRGQLPGWFLESTKEVAQFLQAVGASDITQHAQYPGQLRGPLSLPILQELIDSEDAPFYEHLGDQLAIIKQMRVNRVKQFYPPIRTLHYTGDTLKDEVLVFHTEEILRAGTDFTITVDPATLMPELSAMRRARVVEDLTGPLAILYTNRRTGKLDASKIARAIRYTERDVEDREGQYRKLAQHLIARLWQAQPLPPEIPYPFWDHDTMLDEYEAAMVTTEWLEASPPVRALFQEQFEKHRQFLAAIQQSQMDSVQSQMMQGAVAQATQQAAAKATSVATDAALGQFQAQIQEMLRTRGGPILDAQPGQGQSDQHLLQGMGQGPKMLPAGRPGVRPAAGPQRRPQPVSQ